MRRDRGDVLVGWMVKLVVVLAIGGVIIFDAVSIGVARVNTTDQARTAARTASAEWQNSRDVDRAYATAVAYAEEHGATVRRDSFLAYPDGRVALELRRTATTLVVRRLGVSKDWARVKGNAAEKADL